VKLALAEYAVTVVPPGWTTARVTTPPYGLFCVESAATSLGESVWETSLDASPVDGAHTAVPF
jgi:hypothetical protein